MTVFRKIDNNDMFAQIEVQLTDQELKNAYFEQKHNFNVIDAVIQFFDYVGITSIDDPYELDEMDDNDKKLVDDFDKKYDVKFVNAINVNSQNCLIENAILEFEGIRDCNVAENDTWQEAWRRILKEHEL